MASPADCIARIPERLACVRERILEASVSAGRDPDSFTLVAVSKRKPVEAIVAAYEAGLRHFGENYVQEFESKAPALADLGDARFHLIGKLQSNKSNRAASLFGTIHTVDSVKLARRLGNSGAPLEVFLEVKLSPEQTKSGLEPELVGSVRDAVDESAGLRLSGLMTMPPWNPDPERSRPYFERLRRLAYAHGLGGLSMGMSHDFEIAIQEGATHLRVGTAIFGKRDPKPD